MLNSIKSFILAPWRYRELKVLYIKANDRIVKLEAQLEKLDNQAKQNAVDLHFTEEAKEELEEKVQQLRDANNTLRDQYKNLLVSKGEGMEYFVVVYEDHNAAEVIYVGTNEEEANRIFNENKLYDLRHYKDGVWLSEVTHRGGDKNESSEDSFNQF